MEDMTTDCGTYRQIENFDPYLHEALDRGCAPWMMLDPLCHERALAQLFTDEPDAEKTILFEDTPLAASREASPWLIPITRESPILHWIDGNATLAWGMILASDAPFPEILAHLRSLLLVKSDGEDLIFRFWDGRILSRICRSLPKETPVILGPVRRVLTQNNEKDWVCIDRDEGTFMKARHQPKPALPCPWYRFTETHERLFHDRRPAIVASNISEALLRKKMEHGLELPRNERLADFVTRHVARGLALGLWRMEALELFVRCSLHYGESFPDVQARPALASLARQPIDESSAIAAMSHALQQGGLND
ncbi:MAG: DUF4123 domain-containing protein [Desulfomicrobium apsheronum]|nr:DUF4123 domain-containing protein [Desulfomicrobium apsheronum]